MIAFAYYGGKQTLLPDLLPLLPRCDHFVDLFGGSAAVLLNRFPSPIETYNDINSELVNFFRVLREQPQDLVRALYFTPYAREEFELAWQPTLDPVEQARRTMIRIQMDRAKAGKRSDKSWAVNKKYIAGAHAYHVKAFHTKAVELDFVAARLKNVQIENRPALKIIDTYDSPQTLIYADPPYLPAARTSANDYANEMKLIDHEELAQRFNSCKSKVALSGYDHPCMDDFYPPDRWIKTLFKERRVPMSNKGLRRQEVLWTNYDPAGQYGQTKLLLK